jgi:hypothetical protein
MSLGPGSADRNPLLSRLDVFVGTWREQVCVPDVPAGRMTFEWALDGQFLLQRSEIDDPAFPDSLMIIAPEGAGSDGYVQHYFDARGVARIYEMQFGDGEWTLWRTKADFTALSIRQHFRGVFSEDANTISGEWQSAREGQPWERDFDVTYTRLSDPSGAPSGDSRP